MRRVALLAVLAALLSGYCGSEAAAATLEPIGSFDRPMFVTSDPGDPDRLLVVERDGLVMEASPGGVTVFADVTEWVSCCSGERGLLSIAPAPDFASSGRFYAAYTGKAAAGGVEGDLHVDAFRPDPGAAGALIREPIIGIGHDQLTHYGGQLQFGSDGYLYLSTGDGGGAGDPLGSGQSTDTLLGKILRIDPRPGEEPAYAIPPGNPFVGQTGLDEIWSYGLRNPWRFSFDRASGDMAIADVGQGAREEVDYAPSPAAGVVAGGGANYGWNCREGTIAYSGAPAECKGASGFADPVFDYPHANPGGGAAHGCSITGGYVVRDLSLGDLYGRYVYADFCVGQIRSLVPPGAAGGPATGDRSEGLAVASPTSFGEDSCGRLYVASNGGAVYRLEGTMEQLCPGIAQRAPENETANETASTNPRNPPRTRLRLSAKPAGARTKIVVSASPCADRAGDRVRLNRGGRRLAAKRLDSSCVARFLLRIDGRSTFRALLPAPGGGLPIRSGTLAVEPQGLL